MPWISCKTPKKIAGNIIIITYQTLYTYMEITLCRFNIITDFKLCNSHLFRNKPTDFCFKIECQNPKLHAQLRYVSSCIWSRQHSKLYKNFKNSNTNSFLENCFMENSQSFNQLLGLIMLVHKNQGSLYGTNKINILGF